MKKGLILSLVAVLIVSLAACGAPATKDTSKDTQKDSKVEATSAEAKEDAKEDASKAEDKKDDKKADAMETGVYTLINKTGEKITELYHYENGSKDKGANLADKGLADGDSVESKVELAADKTEAYESTLEFITESGYTAKYETLHFETVKIELIAEDAMTGATPIAFVKGE